MKVTERFSMGWTDPRGIFGGGVVADILKGVYATEQSKQFKDVSTEVLRSLWLVRWGGRRATLSQVTSAVENEEPVVGAMRELCNRGHVRFEEHKSFSTDDVSHCYVLYYVLEREDGDR